MTYRAALFEHVWSDPHFGHANVIKYSERPFADVHEMNEELIARYNERVEPNETCLWLGDCFLCPFEDACTIMSRLNGRKLLVLGNHDRSAARMAAMGFDLVATALTLRIAGQLVRASHLPYRGMDTREPKRSDGDRNAVGALATWDRRGADEWLLHGHTHSRRRVSGQAIHVGVDAWGYRPVDRGEIEAIVATTPAERDDTKEG